MIAGFRIKAAENLDIVRKVFNKSNVKFVLMGGTLLGAIREKNFIEHDDDIDIGCFDVSLENRTNVCFHLSKAGFKYIKNNNDIDYFIKNAIRLEVHWFKYYNDRYVIRNSYNTAIRMDSEYVKIPIEIDFNNDRYLILNHAEEYCCRCYGNDWKVIKNVHKVYPSTDIKFGGKE